MIVPLGNLEVRASSGRGGLQAPPSRDPGTEIKGNTPFWWPIALPLSGENYLKTLVLVNFRTAVTQYLLRSS